MSEFSDDEIAKLREILKYSSEFEEMMALRGAKRVVFRTYRAAVIGTAGLIITMAAAWEHIKAFLRGIIQ